MKYRERHIILKTERLAVGYSSKKKKDVIASGIDFELMSGELVALVGANGIGKSTLIRTLTKLQTPLAGHIDIKGIKLENYEPIELANVMSVVLTEQLISKNMSVNELVGLGRQPYTNWIGTLSNDDREIIQHALNQTGALEYAEKKCYEISDGQLQKAMIARALAQDTELIILDEPTTHLDMYHKAAILKLLKDLANSTGKSILFSSHEIDLAIQLCDRMIVMTGNEVICDSPCKLIERGVFEKLFPPDVIDFDASIGRFKVKN